MTSNVYTKNEILQNLASKGYSIDAYTLDNYFQKWQVEAIFEDDNGVEFFDKNTLDNLLNNTFFQNQAAPNNTPSASADIIQEPFGGEGVGLDRETANILNNISLSDGSSLMSKVQNSPLEDYIGANASNKPQADIIPTDEEPFDFEIQKEKKIGILEGAMLASGQEYTPATPDSSQISEQPAEDDADFDDISLLSESYEAQEKFREYVVSELSKKNMDLTPKSNEFKLDISEKTLNMIARAMAKKIAKHVSQICCQDAKSSAKLAQVEEQNKKLEKRTKELEEQNKKLRLLLVESNKNLNSYKPSIFGLYKKVSSGK